jgi:hypothetical protein
LGRVGRLLARIQATARLHAAQDVRQFLLQLALVQGYHQATRFSTHYLCRFEETAVRVLPAPQLDEPVLQEHRTELGIHFTQDAPGFLTASLINVPMLFPQPKQAFDLPA